MYILLIEILTDIYLTFNNLFFRRVQIHQPGPVYCKQLTLLVIHVLCKLLPLQAHAVPWLVVWFMFDNPE